jgi:hypothetical protein
LSYYFLFPYISSIFYREIFFAPGFYFLRSLAEILKFTSDMPPLNANEATTIIWTMSPGFNNTASSFVDESSFFNGAECFAYGYELVDEGMLFLIGGLDPGLRKVLSDINCPNPELSPDQPSDASLRNPPEETQRRPHLSTTASQEQMRLGARIESARQSYRAEAQNRDRFINRHLNSRTTAEKIKLLGRIVSEGRIPEEYHKHFKDQIAILRRRFQIEREAEERQLRNQSQTSNADPEEHTPENRTASNGSEFAE